MTDGAAFPSGALRRLARWPAATLFLLCLVAWVPGFFTLPPLDRDESRFAQASKQMVETGNLVDIRFSEGARYNKPIGIYWLQSASAKVLGGPSHTEIWAYRIPSLIGGFLALLFAYWCARAFASRETALLSAALLGATLLLTAEAKIATTDAVLLATILAAQAVFMRIYLAARDATCAQPPIGIVLAGWVVIAAGILIKGPVILAVLGVDVRRNIAVGSRLALAEVRATGVGSVAGRGPRGAVGNRHRHRESRGVLPAIARARFRQQDHRRPRIAWRAAGLFSSALELEFVASHAARAAGDYFGIWGPPPRGAPLSARLGRCRVAFVRARPHEASALHPPGLSRDCDARSPVGDAGRSRSKNRVGNASFATSHADNSCLYRWRSRRFPLWPHGDGGRTRVFGFSSARARPR